jgi:tetratricopeptide (TPR) repeat protein
MFLTPVGVPSPLLRALAPLLLILGAAPLAGLPQGVRPPVNAPQVEGGKGSLVVHVKAVSGAPLSNASVTLYTDTLDPTGNTPTTREDGGEFSFEFQGLLPGLYVVEASAEGLQEAKKVVELSPTSQTEVITLVLKPLSAILDTTYAPEAAVYTPLAQKETLNALRDLESQKFADAREHLNFALRASPGNAQINFLLGMTYVWTGHEAEAKPHLEKAHSLDPGHVQSLLALGYLRHRYGDYAGAIELLDRATKLAPTSWQVHWMLAEAHLRLSNFLLARERAERAIELGHEKAAGAQLVLAQALTSLGENREAAGALRAYLRIHPQDADAEKLRGWIAELEHGGTNSAPPPPLTTARVPDAASIIPTGVLPVASSTRDFWAPPDTDATVPPVVPGQVCSLPKVLAGAGKRATELVTNLEQFSAREDYESVEIGADGQIANPISASFDYLVFIRHLSSDLFSMEEQREQHKVVTPLPGLLQDGGAPAIVMVFHPNFQDEYEMKCEGLGQWNGQAAWLVHFQQRPDRPARLRRFVHQEKGYYLRLRGRAWISAESFQVMHLETDLLEPVPAIRLQREHMSVDYQLVPFPKHKVDLWLPQQVHIYFDFKGRLYHHYHHFTDFRLFTVDVEQQIRYPKEKKTQP